jgi:sugar-specific transcriptional regulator TrmB
MADPISLASGLLALVTFALKSSTVLYDTVQSYRSHPKNVRDLKDELEALAGVLQALSETVKQNKDTDFTALKLPLLRCGNACGEFGEALAHCSSRSGGSKTSFRDWAKLKYMGDGIDEFRRMLAGYKSTINIALADANLRQSSVTIEGLETYKVMIKDATADLEDHLKSIDSKLESTFSRAADESAGDATQMRQMQEERSSTQQGLAICAQLSAHIARVQPRLAADHGQGSTDARAVPPAVAERITREGLEECQDALINTANRLEKHLKSIMDRLMARSKTALSSPQAAADLERLQEEWETARLCLDICSKANENTTKVTINVFENIKGDEEVMQFFASTTGKIVHAKDISLGPRGVQFGGQLSDASIQQISRDFSRADNMAPADATPRDATPEVVTPADAAGVAAFYDRYGSGFKLALQESQEDALSSATGQRRH